MFGMRDFEIPFRTRKDLARAQQWRSLSRRQTAPASSILNGMWLPMMNEEAWRRGFRLDRVPSDSHRFEEIHDQLPPRPSRPYDRDYIDPYTTQSERHSSTKGQRQSFEVAAATLFEALNDAVGYCKDFDIDFKYGIQLWAAPELIDALWAMKIDWNGIPACGLAKNPHLKPAEHNECFSKHVRALALAWENMQCCGPLPLHTSIGKDFKLSPLEIRTTMKKVEVTLRGIQELIQMVRTDRSRMPALVSNLRQARDALLDMEEVWDPSKRTEPQDKSGTNADSGWSR